MTRRVFIEPPAFGRVTGFKELTEPQRLSIQRAYKRKQGISQQDWRELWKRVWEDVDQARYNAWECDFLNDQPKVSDVEDLLRAFMNTARPLRKLISDAGHITLPQGQHVARSTLEGIYNVHFAPFKKIGCPTGPAFFQFYVRILSGAIAASEFALKECERLLGFPDDFNWNFWIRQLIAIMDKHGFATTARKSGTKSPFEVFVSRLEPHIPPKTRKQKDGKSLASAIHRARSPQKIDEYMRHIAKEMGMTFRNSGHATTEKNLG